MTQPRFRMAQPLVISIHDLYLALSRLELVSANEVYSILVTWWHNFRLKCVSKSKTSKSSKIDNIVLWKSIAKNTN